MQQLKFTKVGFMPVRKQEDGSLELMFDSYDSSKPTKREVKKRLQGIGFDPEGFEILELYVAESSDV